ncbi:YbaB/EbfC family nucleoid-associated protein [Streptomyces sp. NPDC051172]|uniref:YbaB/EbfC family nucleoid-associated protein n=1 Tax=Streptomyces sp. NPDC051172 TaxID=3155796 RepID=UPI003433F89B
MPDEEQIDFSAFAERARRMQGAMADAQQDLRTVEATGHSTDGMVTATVSGESRVVDLRIHPSVIDPDDPDGLARLVLQAIDSAHDSVDEQRTEVLSGITGGLQGILASLNSEKSEPAVVPRLSKYRPR